MSQSIAERTGAMPVGGADMNAILTTMLADITAMRAEIVANVADLVALRAAFVALTAKIDTDSGDTGGDSNYAATVDPAALTGAAPAALTTTS